MASFIVQPNVAEFVDVVMHERSMEFRMQEIEVPATSPLAGLSLREPTCESRPTCSSSPCASPTARS